MQKIKYQQFDVFTAVPFVGGPVAVVLESENLSDDQMQKIACEVNSSQTAFLQQPVDSQADFQIRAFTPQMEIVFSGQAIAGTFLGLAQAGKCDLDSIGQHFFYVETGLGVLQVAVVIAENRLPFVRTALPAFNFHEPQEINFPLLARYLKISQVHQIPDLPLAQWESFLIAPVPTLKILDQIDPDFRALRNLGKTIGVDTFVAFTLEHNDAVSTNQLRVFRPALGIYEESVTSLAHGLVGTYLFKSKVLEPQTNEIAYIGEQGDNLARSGRVLVKISIDDDQISSLEIGGTGVAVIEGVISL